MKTLVSIGTSDIYREFSNACQKAGVDYKIEIWSSANRENEYRCIVRDVDVDKVVNNMPKGWIDKII